MGVAAATRQRLMEASLARSAYCDAAVFADEQRLAMATSWVCIGRGSSVSSQPGSYRLASVAGERVLVVRDHDGSLGAFANRCMHRGTELVDSSSPIASACFESVIRCPYHFWAYGFDGSLQASPWVDDIDRGLGRVSHDVLSDRDLDGLFEAAVDATEEAVLDSLFRATTTVGRFGRVAEALPINEMLELI
ncbi:MAG TPA: Rieske 2Fe-2S domain-containing protein [Ilumatobacteraceae bacterium]|nr:Rieske 2Fe-2S domain-containing protein [Ilumatobacteraceae bacterium]